MNPPPFFEEAIDRLLAGEALAPFTAWFSQAMAQHAGQTHPVHAAAAEHDRRLFIHGARELWGHIPLPEHQWRPRGLPKTERNAACHCGSGRKFKHCCADLEHAGMPISPEALMTLALSRADPQWLTPQHLRKIPPALLGELAMQWNEEGMTQKTLAVLAPLFAQPAALDERHEMALDALVDAMQRLGQDAQRRLLLERMAQHPEKALAMAARCRLVSVLADQGEEAAAWALFQEASRLSPNDPQLWHLELTLLLAQGRQDEARLRAPLLAARARKIGLDDLAQMLLQMAQDGLDGVLDVLGDEVEHPEDLDWLALVEGVPKAVDQAECLALYQVLRLPPEQGDPPATGLWIRPNKALTTLNKRWQRKFQVGKPELTWLDADVDTLITTLPAAADFLQKNPEGWHSSEVLDDLLLAARDLCMDNPPRPVLQAARRLADHAVAVLRVLVGDDPHTRLEWAETDHRPLLRCLALAVELCRIANDEKHALALMQWGLSLNPNDNHGWRAMVAPLLIEQGKPAEALALMDRYPDDLPPSEHVRALALFALNRRDEAEAVLRAAHQVYPLFLKALWPEAMDEPDSEPGPGVRLGGETAAWYFRMEWRPLWVRSGALAWARALALPDPPPRPKPAASPAPAKRGRSPSASQLPPGMSAIKATFGPKEEKRLAKTCSDVPRLHGLLTAVAWSPQMLMPNTWLPLALALHDRMPNSRTEATALKAHNEVLQVTMQLYNHTNAWVLNNVNTTDPLVSMALGLWVSDDATACAWAAGFVSGCEAATAAWARAGHKVAGQTGPFGKLRALASRAAVNAGADRVLRDDGGPLLQAVEDAPGEAGQSLVRALTALWPVVAAHRQATR